MKRVLCTLSLYGLTMGLVWLTGWLLVSGWYSEKFAKPYMPILNYSALPAVISAIVCILTEILLRRLAINPMILVLLMFVLRVALMLGLTAMSYIIFLAGGQNGKYELVSFVLTAFCFYGALLSGHVFSNLVDSDKLTEK